MRLVSRGNNSKGTPPKFDLGSRGKKKGFHILDQIPIRISTVYTPQFAYGAGPVDHFPAFEHLRGLF